MFNYPLTKVIRWANRKKIQCESCGSVFDNVFKTRHETVYHNKERVRVKESGVPSK